MSGWTIGSVTLPYGPERVNIAGPPKVEYMELDGDDPIATVLIPATNGLVLNGTVSSVAGNKSTVNSTYVAPILAARGTSISVTDPDGIYSGTFLLKNAVFSDESIGNYVRYRYVITLEVVKSVTAL